MERELIKNDKEAIMDTLIEIVGAIIDFVIGIIGSGSDRYFKRKNSKHKKRRKPNEWFQFFS